MNITLKPIVWRSSRGNGFYCHFTENGHKDHMPIHNFRKTRSGAARLITECVNQYAEEMEKFHNIITVFPIEYH